MNRSQFKRMISFIVLGIVLSVAVSTLMITLGYFTAYDSVPQEYTVSIFGLPVYELQRVGYEYEGAAINSNMKFIGITFCIFSVSIGESLYQLLKKRKKIIASKGGILCYIEKSMKGF